ncbi:MAG TPA: hypothetical protein VLT15_05005 [Acidimicrobiia bacterium]|nr:hypothetical protein [Acidimicrobiia bacterium]
MFEAVEFVEIEEVVGRPNPTPSERVIGTFTDEREAVAAGRLAKQDFHAAGRSEYAWWVVRSPGAQLANWIADSSNNQEFVLDLRTGQLVEVD